MKAKDKASPAATPVTVENRYLNRDEVAAHLNCSPRQVTVMVRQGLLPVYDVSHSMKRYKVEDIEAFMQSRRKQSSSNVERRA